MKVELSSIVLALLLSGCAFIAGPETNTSPEGQTPVRLLFVESLRDEASLKGEGFKESAGTSTPAAALTRPSAVYADAFRVYVTDSYIYKPTSSTTSGARIFIFDRGSRSVNILDSSGNVRLLSPAGIAVDATNVIFVSDSQQGRVFGFDINGNPLVEIGKSGDLASPAGLAVDRQRNRLYVADQGAHRIKVYNSLGLFMYDIESRGDAKGMQSPVALCTDRDGKFYVLDGRQRSVLVYGPDGTHLREFKVFDPAGMSVRPRGIAVDSDGNVYITDVLNNRILIFGSNGMFRQAWGRAGTLFGDFWTPAGIFIDDRDYVYVADQTNGRVQVFQYVKQQLNP